MRKTMWGAAAALALASFPVAAGTPVTTQPLAAGEVLLEVNALGVETSRADIATVQVQLSAHGATEAEARREHSALVRRLTATARGAGVAAADVDVSDVTIEDSFDLSTFDVEEAPPVDEFEAQQLQEGVPVPVVRVPAPSAGEGDLSVGKIARSTMVVTVRDVARAPAVREALSGEGATALMPPQYRLTDDRAARRAARADAIAAARADAEAYASALGMRVVRVVRVSERLGVDLIGLGLTEWREIEQIGMRFMTRDGEVQTFVAVGVDFALAPQ